MTYHYLSHLAKLGASDLHPHGPAATALLLDALDLTADQTVLDLGCGTGGTMVSVAGMSNVTVTGVDALPEMMQVARWRLCLAGLLRRVHLVPVRAGERLPFPDSSFDRVYVESVIGFQDQAAAAALLAEAFRVLKSGGRFVANEAVWKPGTSDHVVASVHASSLADFGLCQASPQNWSAAEWRRAMTGAGFSVVSDVVIAPEDMPLLSSRPLRARRGHLLSRALSQCLRARLLLSPRLFARHMRYRRSLKAHRDDGRFVEARLFILSKP